MPAQRMRDYLKILSSIVLALLFLATVISIIAGTFSLVADSSTVTEAVSLPFIIASMGFILFGITGSLLWLYFQKLLGNTIANLMGRQVIAASLSVVANCLLFVMIFTAGGSIYLKDIATILVFIVPVVVCSLLIYWRLYAKPKQHND